MERFELVEALKERVVFVEFIKESNNEARLIRATLNPEALPEGKVAEGTNPTPLHEREAIAVWDTDLQAWRSFRFDNVYMVDGQPVQL